MLLDTRNKNRYNLLSGENELNTAPREKTTMKRRTLTVMDKTPGWMIQVEVMFRLMEAKWAARPTCECCGLKKIDMHDGTFDCYMETCPKSQIFNGN